jgi:multidrug efflux pump subunit AcrA (membrane-fusion protein)
MMADMAPDARRALCGLCVIGVCLAIGGVAAAQNAFDVPINCTVKPLQEVLLSATMAGVVREVLVVPGERVIVGDLIVRMDDRMARAERDAIAVQLEARSVLESARTRAGALQSRLVRLQGGFDQNAISASELEIARLEWTDARGAVLIEHERAELLEAELLRADLALELFEVRSPVNGVIGEDLVNPGESAAQMPVVTIYVNQPLRVEAFVPSAILSEFLERDTYASRINGQDVPLILEFDYFSEIADLASNTVSVYFRLDAPDVLPGSQCEIL